MKAILPYWENLRVLRTYQTELGRDVPVGAPPDQSADR